MKVVIIKSNNPNNWYTNRIDQIYDVREDSDFPESYTVVNDKELLNNELDSEVVGYTIEKEDCIDLDKIILVTKQELDGVIDMFNICNNSSLDILNKLYTNRLIGLQGLLIQFYEEKLKGEVIWQEN